MKRRAVQRATARLERLKARNARPRRIHRQNAKLGRVVAAEEARTARVVVDDSLLAGMKWLTPDGGAREL